MLMRATGEPAPSNGNGRSLQRPPHVCPLRCASDLCHSKRSANIVGLPEIDCMQLDVPPTERPATWRPFLPMAAPGSIDTSAHTHTGRELHSESGAESSKWRTTSSGHEQG